MNGLNPDWVILKTLKDGGGCCLLSTQSGKDHTI